MTLLPSPRCGVCLLAQQPAQLLPSGRCQTCGHEYHIRACPHCGAFLPVVVSYHRTTCPHCTEPIEQCGNCDGLRPPGAIRQRVTAGWSPAGPKEMIEVCDLCDLST